MDIYITNTESGEDLHIPVNPQEVQDTESPIFQAYSVIRRGTIKLPDGNELKTFSWESFFPGITRILDPYVKGWLPPDAAKALLKGWSQKGAVLRLLITETDINYDVRITSFNGSYKGGNRDYYYSIALEEAKELKVYASGEKTPATSTASTVQNKPEGAARTSPPPAETATVKSGDSLWVLAEKFMGDGSLYPELYEANKGLLDGKNAGLGLSKFTIFPGQVLTIPAPGSSSPPII